MAELEIGMGKSGRRAYGLDDLALVPSRRTRDPEDIDLSWEIDAFTFDLPIMAAAMDSVVSPASAVAIGELGGVGVLALEGLWTRYDDPEAVLAEIAGLTDTGLSGHAATARLQELYAEPIKPELIRDRIKEIRGAGVTSCASISPQRLPAYADALLAAELDLLVVQGSVVSAEHVTKDGDPLNLKTFVRRFDIPVIVGGCASYQAASHLMRTGAAGILVGVGSGATSTTRRVLGVGAAQATAIADARAARMRHLDETGVYVHLIADGGITTGGDIAKAVACGADAVMLGAPLAAASDAPGAGWHWGLNGGHADLPRADRVPAPSVGTIEEILVGPAHRSDGRTNLAGALRRSMASCGYPTLKDLQKAELTITPVHP
ncbi:GuaB3 family IMP dehydrogenase-related protein [Aquihabitans sp. McL0605]|uniref:GuaB3 family IMP dehydrogenase-related protein n=1 Tax=Aquihabitans sp. McL0605 TaxID=3415671 RepID=UPI003CF3B35F